jgi:hypothetical protein
VTRLAAPRETSHLQQLVDRLTRLPVDTTTSADRVLDRADHLARRVLARDDVLPVAQRWHGDFAPWNRARAGSGQLWVWDWENSEADALAGLDALHWAVSESRPPTGRATSVDLPRSLESASRHLSAAGVPRSGHGLVAAVYALTVLERALDLASRSGGWDTLWITPAMLRTLVEQADALLAR